MKQNRLLPYLFLSVTWIILFQADMLYAQQRITEKPDSLIKADTLMPVSTDSIIHTLLPFTLELRHIGQYMQSVQLIFTLTNNEPEQLTNFWLHVSLLDKNKQFLYREQPVLFAELQAGSSQSIELLCESVSVDEIGFIVLHPQLLELSRTEQKFNTNDVELIQASQSEAVMLFNSSLR